MNKFITTSFVLLSSLAALATDPAMANNWSLVDLGEVTTGNHYTRSGINNNAEVVGHWNGPYLWSDGVKITLGSNGTAGGINNFGQVVGASSFNFGTSHATLWNNGIAQDLGTLLGTYYSHAYGLNDLGQVVGESFNMGGVQYAFLWDNGVMQNLSPLTHSYGINNNSQVVGTMRDQSGNDRAVIWNNGLVIDISDGEALDINEDGQVVGWTQRQQPFLWGNGVFNYLDVGSTPLSSGAVHYGIAYSINNSGQAVGFVTDNGVNPYPYAALWDNGLLIDLRELVKSTGWILVRATGINDKGQISVYGTSELNIDHAFLLTIDNIPPTINTFTIPEAYASNTISITDFTADDNIVVAGYLITETNSPPATADPKWSITAPASYTFTSTGSKTLYAWVKDGVGNVSGSTSANTLITYDTTLPDVTVFTLPASSNSLTVDITSFASSDNVGVTGYCVSESNSSNSCNWSSMTPSSYSFAEAGHKTLYAFAKDSVGNVSNSVSANTTVTLPVTVVYGDLNNDGEVTATDAQLVLQMAIGKRVVDLKADLAPLVNGVPSPDGKVTAADALVILRKAVGLW